MKNDAVVVQEKVTGIAGVLTDGTGVSPFDLTKFVKDFAADVLLSGAAALVAVRAGLRWATT